MKKKFKLPSALVIVYVFLLIVAVLTWLVPVSVVVSDDDGNKQIVYNADFDEDGNVVENAGTKPMGLWDIIMYPIKGFSNAADVVVAILVSGSMIGVLNYVGALDAGIGLLLKKFTGSTLIIFLTLTFSLMGTVYGSWEELPAYALVIIPLFVKAGYDVMTGIAVIFVGAIAGNMASVVNPFSTGAAVNAIGNPELSPGSGILLRLVLFVLLTGIGTILLLQYANKVKADKSKSVLADYPEVKDLIDHEDTAVMPEMTSKRKWSLIVFGIAIFMTIVGYIPWDTINFGEATLFEVLNYPQDVFFPETIPFLGHLLGGRDFTPWGWWYFDEFSWSFLIGVIVIAFINGMSEKEFVTEFVRGAADLLGVCIVLGTSRGIALMMGSRTEGMSVTFVYWIQGILAGVPIWAFALGALITYISIGLFLQSTSGVAGITMPILGAVAMALFSGTVVGEVGGQIILISAFTVGLNFTCVLYPTATVMGVMELTNSPFDVYFTFMLKILFVMLVAAGILLSVAPYIGLV